MSEEVKSNAKKNEIGETLEKIPAQTGVYLMKDKNGRVIYVGKARNLRSRVGSYFRHHPNARQQMLVSQIADIDYVLTSSDVEALITENRLIKEYQPKYNVSLKDDKTYPYLKITGELYPRLEVSRPPEKPDRAEVQMPEIEPRYFGPYTEAGAVRQTLRFLNKLFPLRQCRQPLDGTPQGRPCLNYQMKRCLGPCQGKEVVSPEEYGEMVQEIELFLEGKQENLKDKLEAEMKEAANNMEFERAAVLRDRLEHLRKLLETQKILAMPEGDYDVLGLIRLHTENREGEPVEAVSVYMYRIRAGRLKERENFALRGTSELTDSEIMEGFIKDYYSRGVFFPQEIIVSQMPEEEELISQWLSQLSGGKIKINRPQRGFRHEVLERCMQEGYTLVREKLKRGSRLDKDEGEEAKQALEELCRLAGVDEVHRMEGYDISHLRGGEAVGSMVVFEEGVPFKDGYRRFKIRQQLEGDDYRAMQEMLGRRFRRDDMPLPDLVVIDGGMAQLNVLRQVLAEVEAPIAALALAKKHEEVYVPGLDQPVRLPGHSPGLKLLRRIRDEAHRFALDYHRKLREKSASLSVLDRIPGVGAKRKAEILRHFGSMDALLKASPEEIRQVPGISEKLALTIHDHLHR